MRSINKNPSEEGRAATAAAITRQESGTSTVEDQTATCRTEFGGASGIIEGNVRTATFEGEGEHTEVGGTTTGTTTQDENDSSGDVWGGSGSRFVEVEKEKGPLQVKSSEESDDVFFFCPGILLWIFVWGYFCGF